MPHRRWLRLHQVACPRDPGTRDLGGKPKEKCMLSAAAMTGILAPKRQRTEAVPRWGWLANDLAQLRWIPIALRPLGLSNYKMMKRQVALWN